jgi:hypothetical protein
MMLLDLDDSACSYQHSKYESTQLRLLTVIFLNVL